MRNILIVVDMQKDLNRCTCVSGSTSDSAGGEGENK